jgi:hypothetical protein
MPQFDGDVLQRFEDNSSTSTLWLLINLVLIVVLCGMMYVSSSSNLHISRRCRLWAPKITFNEINLHVVQRSNAEKPDFPAVVLFTGEACFSREGVFNSHNNHVRAEETPHAAAVRCHQQRFAIDVWAGILYVFLIGPYLLPSQLSAQIYWVSLEEMLSEFLEEVPLSLRRNMWFQHGRAAAHFTRQV